MGEAATGRLTSLSMKRLAYALAALIAIVDQLTKIWAEKILSDGSEIHVIGDYLTFLLVYNPGAAFSFGTGSTWFFTLFSVIVIAAIIWILRHVASRPWAIVLGVILGGAVGNFIDRLFRDPSFGQGHVVDFINYNGFFVGNVADIALVLGVIAVVGLELASVPFGRSKDDAVVEPAEDSDE